MAAKSFSGSYPHRREEEAYANLSQQQVGGRVGVGHEMYFMSVCTNQYCHNERAASKTEFHRHRHSGELDRQASCYDAEEYANEHCHKVRLVETLHGVAEFACQELDVVKFPDNSYAVAYLEPEVGAREEIHAGAVHAGDVEFVGVAKMQRPEFHSIIVGLRYKNSARHYRAVVHRPFHVYSRTNES